MPYETLVYINIVLFVCSSESLSAGHVCVFRSSWEEMTESVPPVLRSSSWGLMCPCSTITSRSSSGSVSRRLSWGGRGWNSATAPRRMSMCTSWCYFWHHGCWEASGPSCTSWGCWMKPLQVLFPVCSCWVSVPPFRDWHGVWHTGPEWCKGCLLPITSLQMRRRWSLLTVWLLRRYILWCLGRSLWVM